ncbi:MAG: hypothetical protein M3R38_03290 [Actinomycetota bacterium]|nr:hypothetical protein [Actinomycetota bacterium]
MGRDRGRQSDCAHDQTVLVSPTDGGRVARCLVCGTVSPPRQTSEEARRALEALARPGRGED